MFNKIYIDLDGVLADFFSEWKKIVSKDWWELSDNLLAIQKIREQNSFWLKLPLLKNSINLLEILKQNNLPYTTNIVEFKRINFFDVYPITTYVSI